MKTIVIIGALLLASVAQAQQPPTGKERLALKLAQSELEAANYLDEIAALRKQIEALMAKREEPKK